MRGILATDPRAISRLFSALALVVGLAGCSDVDTALFGDEGDNGATPGSSSDQFPPGGPEIVAVSVVTTILDTKPRI